MQEIINLYNSPILKWERFNEHLKIHSRTAKVSPPIIGNVERAIYAAAESREKVNVLGLIETELAEYKKRLIRKSVE